MYHLVRFLAARGYSQRAIARALDLSRGTVKHTIQSETFPDYLRGVPRPSKIDMSPIGENDGHRAITVQHNCGGKSRQ